MPDARPLELTPVVNVVMLLIFFFLLSWSFVLQPGVEVRLPVTSFPVASNQGRHVITLKTSGKDDVMLFFDEKSVDETQLKTALDTVAEKFFGDWITLNADESVPQGRLQQVAALAMSRGFHVTVATQSLSATATQPSAAP